MKIFYSQSPTTNMEENSNLPSTSLATSSSVTQIHNSGNGGHGFVSSIGQQPFGGVNTSAANNKTLSSGENDVSGTSTASLSQQSNCKEQNPVYTMPGVLHFLQHEWARFELERSQWELDRAEFQARIAFLQGERKGQENLKTDLVRRIKMLEYALKQERVKYHKLKYGTDLVIQGDEKFTHDESSAYNQSSEDGGGGSGNNELLFTSVSNISWRQGRQLLRQYLNEIGYTDMIIDVRSNRVRSLLGLNNNVDPEDSNAPALNGNELPTNKRAYEFKNKQFKNASPQKEGCKLQPSSIAEAMIMDTEAAVMANFEFLGHTDIDMEDDENEVEEEIYDPNADTKQKKTSAILGEDVDAEAEEVLNELNLLTEHEESIIHVEDSQEYSNEWNTARRMDRDSRHSYEESGTSLGLGELAQLTVNNDAEAAYEMTTNNEEAYRKSWNAKYTLRSHFDAVRALVFHPSEPVLVTASDDHTLKLWNLHKTVPAKKSASLDVEPLYTFRSHSGPVLCLAMDNAGNQCFSGGSDGKIHCWALPATNIDPYDSFDPGLLIQTLIGHTDAVWGLSFCHPRSKLLSVSADNTVKLWNPSSKLPLLNTYVSEKDRIPTSIDFIMDDPHKLVVAYEESCVIFDVETASIVSRLDGSETQGVNRIVAHPVLPLIIAANEDHHIRFYDHRSATLAHAMVAHLDAVTSLAVDPNGLYLLSGSHDCSIRLWNMDNKTCVQEITAHRKKFDESILDVAFHPTRPFIASAGADALAKVFV